MGENAPKLKPNEGSSSKNPPGAPGHTNHTITNEHPKVEKTPLDSKRLQLMRPRNEQHWDPSTLRAARV